MLICRKVMGILRTLGWRSLSVTAILKTLIIPGKTIAIHRPHLYCGLVHGSIHDPHLYSVSRPRLNPRPTPLQCEPSTAQSTTHTFTVGSSTAQSTTHTFTVGSSTAQSTTHTFTVGSSTAQSTTHTFTVGSSTAQSTTHTFTVGSSTVQSKTHTFTVGSSTAQSTTHTFTVGSSTAMHPSISSFTLRWTFSQQFTPKV